MKDTTKTTLTRRGFIRNSAAAAFGFTIVPRHVLGATDRPAPSDEITRAVVGVGGMGRGHLGYAGARTIAVCDVDRGHLQSALDSLEKGVKGCTDFREVLAMPEVDVVLREEFTALFGPTRAAP